jgi:Anti-sigma-K factor rskA, C-terminal
MKLRRDDLHTLSGVYVLDALGSTAERDRYEHHLGRCQTCAGEVRGLREVTTDLAMAAAVQPPPALRPQVLAAVRRTRQLPPVIEAEPRRGPRRGWWAGLRSGWLPRLAVGFAAAGAAAAVVLAVILAGVQQRLDDAQAENHAIAAVLAAPDARVLARPTSEGGRATVVLSRAERELIVTTAGLPPLPRDKVYEAWLINPRQTRPAGLLPAPSGGRTQPLLATGLSPGDTLGLTVEPAGGTAQPTTKPIVLIPLST